MDKGKCMSTDETVIEVATKDELLKFVNDIREILEMNPLGDLLPSYPEVGNECLIANPLMKFGADVSPLNNDPTNRSDWYIEFEEITAEQEHKIADFLTRIDPGKFALPEKIAAAAYEFDLGNAFQEYNLDLINGEEDEIL